MRFLKSAICVVLAFFCLSVSVFAYTLPHTYTGDNGVVTIGVFEVARWEHDADPNNYKVFEKWNSVKRASRNVIFFDPSADEYIFCLIPEGKSATCTYTGSGVKLNVGAPFDTFRFVRSGNRYVFSGCATISPYEIFPVFVVSSYFRNNPPYPSFPTSVMAEFGNAIAIEDDIGNPLPPLEEEDETKGFWETLLGWLSSFWDKLKSFFVPSEGHFDDWFNEIRTAFNKKLGGLDSIFNRISSSFENMSSSNFALKVVIPKGVFYSGFAGYEVNLVPHMQPILNFIRPIFTAFIVVMTVISCYKRLIEVINT